MKTYCRWYSLKSPVSHSAPTIYNLKNLELDYMTSISVHILLTHFWVACIYHPSKFCPLFWSTDLNYTIWRQSQKEAVFNFVKQKAWRAKYCLFSSSFSLFFVFLQYHILFFKPKIPVYFFYPFYTVSAIFIYMYYFNVCWWWGGCVGGGHIVSLLSPRLSVLALPFVHNKNGFHSISFFWKD